MLMLSIALATTANAVIIIHKVRKVRIADATVDVMIMCLIANLFAGTFSGMVIGTLASAGVSAYLWFRPVVIIPDNFFSTLTFWRK